MAQSIERYHFISSLPNEYLITLKCPSRYDLHPLLPDVSYAFKAEMPAYYCYLSTVEEYSPMHTALW